MLVMSPDAPVSNQPVGGPDFLVMLPSEIVAPCSRRLGFRARGTGR
jgi:hypothetical protein